MTSSLVTFNLAECLMPNFQRLKTSHFNTYISSTSSFSNSIFEPVHNVSSIIVRYSGMGADSDRNTFEEISYI